MIVFCLHSHWLLFAQSPAQPVGRPPLQKGNNGPACAVAGLLPVLLQATSSLQSAAVLCMYCTVFQHLACLCKAAASKQHPVIRLRAEVCGAAILHQGLLLDTASWACCCRLL
jgi:hypothetical protein